jgi:predicted transcriptional regulator
VLERYAYVLLNIEKYWNRLCDQNRAGKNVHAFVRRSLVGPKEAKLLLFYVTFPHKEIRGVGDFIERITGDTDDLWNTYGHESLLESYKEYMDFLQGRTKATFIRFKNLRVLTAPVPASRISQVTGIGIMPRMGKYITKEMANRLI